VAGSITTASASPDPEIDVGNKNLITWDLELPALAALNSSAQAQNGFWIQLDFGPRYVRTNSDGTIKLDSYRNMMPSSATKFPEYLTTELTVSPVPLPTAFWLSGTALIRFAGRSRRTRIS